MSGLYWGLNLLVSVSGMPEGKLVKRVEQLITEGKLYRPVDEFVERLGLHLSRTPDRELLYSLLKGMATVAKGMKGRDRKSGEQYVRSMAKEILMRDMANRDWIEENICALPRPKPVKEAKLYDREALCRDIRLKDNPEWERVVSNAAEGGQREGTVLDVSTSTSSILDCLPNRCLLGSRCLR